MSMKIISNIKTNLVSAKESQKKIIFTIATNSGGRLESYSTPVRIYKEYFIFGCIVFDEKILPEIINIIDGNVDHILVDSEKKLDLDLLYEKNIEENTLEINDVLTGNLARIVFELANKSPVSEYKPNDLTVDAAWSLLSKKMGYLSGKKASVIGAGNIGSKLALKLVESGVEVAMYRRDFHTCSIIANAINLIKPNNTLASAYASRNKVNACFMSDIIIGSSSSNSIITKKLLSVAKRNVFILDVGKGNISTEGLECGKKAKLDMVRLDVTPNLITTVVNSIETYDMCQKNFGRKKIKDSIYIVSGGYYGELNDIVVDSIHSPKLVYGIADGRGNIINKPNKIQSNLISEFKDFYNIYE